MNFENNTKRLVIQQCNNKYRIDATERNDLQNIASTSYLNIHAVLFRLVYSVTQNKNGKSKISAKK